MPPILTKQFLISGTEQLPEEGNLMYYFAEEGMRLLREYDDQQPFYLRVDFNGPASSVRRSRTLGLALRPAVYSAVAEFL